jgi:hypothetical protein
MLKEIKLILKDFREKRLKKKKKKVNKMFI